MGRQTYRYVFRTEWSAENGGGGVPEDYIYSDVCFKYACIFFSRKMK